MTFYSRPRKPQLSFSMVDAKSDGQPSLLYPQVKPHSHLSCSPASSRPPLASKNKLTQMVSLQWYPTPHDENAYRVHDEHPVYSVSCLSPSHYHLENGRDLLVLFLNSRLISDGQQSWCMPSRHRLQVRETQLCTFGLSI